jgi:hypothetical protein
VTPANLISGYRATGVFLFNLYIIPEEALAPYFSTQEYHANDEIVNPARQLPEEAIQT